jgi:hypothetical protein
VWDFFCSNFDLSGCLFAQTRGKSFRPPFSKGGAVKGAEPLSPRTAKSPAALLFLVLFLLRLFF